MKKHLLTGLIMLAACVCASAGDVAAFVDLGISSDGKTYVFGEYGKTDQKFQGYAEIYAVDIEKNDFVDGKVFKTNPSSQTVSKSGKATYDDLYSKVSWALKKFDCKPVCPEQVLFIRQDGKVKNSEIVFKDFEGSTVEQSVFYYIDIVKNVEKNGDKAVSSFFISLEKKDSNGHVISRNVVGNPQIKRKGVMDYEINRIMTDASGRNLVFVIEKTLQDDTGPSIRYMVETVRL